MDTQTLEDKQAISDLQNYYSFSIDSGEYDNLEDVFVPDVIADYGVAGFNEGLEQVKSTCRNALDPLTSAQHMNGNNWADIDGDEAIAGCYFQVHMYLESAPGGEHFEMGGRYDDELIRTAGGWRIEKRKITILWSQGNADIRYVR